MQEYKDAMDRIKNEMRGRAGEKTLAPLLTITIAAGGQEPDEDDEGGEEDGEADPLAKALGSIAPKD